MQRLWSPSPPWGLEEAHNHTERGSNLFHPAHLVSWNWMSSWKTGRSLNTVPCFGYLFWIFTFLGMENSKAAGFCAHWIGSGVKGEQVQRRAGEGIASAGQAAGAKGRVRVFTIDLEEGERRSQVQMKLGVSEG